MEHSPCLFSTLLVRDELLTKPLNLLGQVSAVFVPDLLMHSPSHACVERSEALMLYRRILTRKHLPDLLRNLEHVVRQLIRRRGGGRRSRSRSRRLSLSREKLQNLSLSLLDRCESSLNLLFE
jgi:hypothetical protein